MEVSVMVKGQTVGYVRVSSVDQNEARQLDGVVLDKVFTDKASGKDTKRPQLERALEFCRDGDTLMIHSMDRLARNLSDLEKIVKECVDRGVTVKFKKEALTFERAAGNKESFDYKSKMLMLQIMGAIGQFERELIKERQREGIALAKAKGDVYKGRKPSLSAELAASLRERAGKGENKAALAREFKISRAALYVYLAAS
jgi:DNA invertase Pin-like site-specific DNA recombinase